jgi:hypothetical protein
MFITSRRGYTRDGQQRAEGRFLALFCDKDHNIWGIVRYVRMTQCGHFMMGSMRIGSQQITMSGTYGDDGLPDDIEKISEANRKYLMPMPPDLVAVFWRPGNGGHNDAGAEGPAMRDWGRIIMKGGGPCPRKR